MSYIKQDNPVRIPTGDNKIIEEHFGRVSQPAGDLSIAHMIAPPGWSEPQQHPEFDEFTLVSSGKKLFEVDGEEIVVSAGQSILVKKGSRVRYSNPFAEPCEYWSVCIPAFTIETANRE
jgi:mannose-6-phosphate isomerase-like protein (cupin superfamily)